MAQDIMLSLQEIREKAHKHLSMCDMHRQAAEEGDENATPVIIGQQVHLNPEASIEDAWISALSTAISMHQEETDDMESRHKQERKDLKEIEDTEERSTERIILTRRQAAEKIALKERQKAALQELEQGYPKHPNLDAWIQEQARKIAQENMGNIEGNNYVTPRSADIRDFKHERLDKGVRFRKNSGKGSFTDFGRKIAVEEWNDPQTILAALQLAAEKWPSFTVYGPPKYIKTCAALAAVHGFKIDNPDVKEIVRMANMATGQPVEEPAEKAAKPPMPKM